jgi:hypothetical protein
LTRLVFPLKNYLRRRGRFLYSSVMFTERRQPSPIALTSAICIVLAGLLVTGCERPTQDSASASPTVLATDVAFPGVVFSADPNPVPPGNPKGRTTITWDTGSDAVGEVYVVNAGIEKLFGAGRQGSQEAPWIQPGPNEFRLYDQVDHKLLARLNVTMVIPDSSGKKPAPKPSSSPSP